MVQTTRIHPLNTKPVIKGSYVLYWMQQSQRAVCNHALEYAIDQANQLNQPLIVFFGLTVDYPYAFRRHYHFMLQGLLETQEALYQRGIAMHIEHCDPVTGATDKARDASVLITDRGYLNIQKQWRVSVAKKISCHMIEIESDVIVPVETVSPKEEYSAGTLRPKMLRILEQYLVPVLPVPVKKDSLSIQDTTLTKNRSVDEILDILKPDASVGHVDWICGGSTAAIEHLTSFIIRKLDHFADRRNDPSLDYCSNLSPYLHFGQISPLQIALEIKRKKSPGTMSFLEELIVRRELSMNFAWYNNSYDLYQSIPAWAQHTLNIHASDNRQYVYSKKQLENSLTHDPYWNAAQREMVVRGKMHGYMRMYWGKKIIEWTKTPQIAYNTAIYLNNKYELDGRDPNGYTGIAWCFGKHDRAWKERPVFGKVRFMNAAGLQRKFDIDAYVTRCNTYIS